MKNETKQNYMYICMYKTGKKENCEKSTKMGQKENGQISRKKIGPKESGQIWAKIIKKWPKIKN